MISDYQEKFNTCVTKLKELGDLYSEAKSKSWYSQELKHSVLASIMNKLEGSLSQRENLARASEDYKAYLAETRDDIRAELKLRAAYERQKFIFEGLRSMCALERSTKDLE